MKRHEGFAHEGALRIKDEAALRMNAHRAWGATRRCVDLIAPRSP
jgi:hypothetical protein